MIAENLHQVEQHIKEAMARRTRVPKDAPVKLVAVTKNHDVEAMREAISEVRGGEVTRAVRDSQAADGSPIHDGDVMGIQDGSIDVVGDDVKKVTLDLIARMQDEEEGDSLTILAGSDMDDDAFEDLVDAIEEAQPDLEVDAHRGEQPLYPVVFAIE